jgi:hypothetical protein
MISTVVIGSAALGAWLAAPFVAMGRRGTVDDRTRTAMREEGLRACRSAASSSGSEPGERRRCPGADRRSRARLTGHAG